jgi:hypothetical protein
VTTRLLYTSGLATVESLTAGVTTLASGEITGSLVVGGDFTIVGATLLDTDTIKLRATTKQTIGAGSGTGFVINRANSVASINGISDIITSNGHGFNNGQNVAFISLNTGVTGLSNNTIYRVVQKTDNTFKVASVGAYPTAIDFSTSGLASATLRDMDNPDGQIRWNEVGRYWDLRDVGNTVDATAYSKILTANLISNSLTSTSADTMLSSQGANTLDGRIVTANTNLKNYSDSTFVKLNPASAQIIAQDLTLSGNVIISQNLTISGTVTTVNTQELNIADNEIVLNSDVPTGTAPSQDAGFTVNRGSSTNTYIRWNETVDSWVANNGISAGEFRLANTTTHLTEGTNLYLTAARVRANVGNTAPILYNSSTGVFSHATSGVTAATHGSSTSVPVFVVNDTGHITSVSNTAIAFPAEADTLATVTARGATTTDAITINNTTAATSNSTGALILKGGISGNANARFDAVFDAGNRVISSVSNTAPINAVVSANTLTLSHATSGVTATTYGTSIAVPVFAVNAEGHVTSVTNTTIRSATTSQTGVVQLEDSVTSTSTANAAVPNSVRTAQNHAAAAFGTANSATTTAQAAFNTANSATTTAQAGFNTANSATTTAQAGFNTANSKISSITITNGTGISGGGTGSAFTLSIGQDVGTTNNVQFRTIGVGTTPDSANTGSIRATGDITAYYSDDRLKTKLGNIENALSKVEQLSGFYYEANEVAQELGYNAKREVGVSAQEVQKVMPEVIAPAPIDEQYLTVKYERMVPLLIEAIKELKQQVDDIKNQLNNQ